MLQVLQSHFAIFNLSAALLLAPPSHFQMEGSVHGPILFKGESSGMARNVWVYLPPSYETNPAKRYPVLYMQDGQQLFAKGKGCLNWHGGWRMDERVDELVRDGEMQEIIVIGISDGGSRKAREQAYLPPGVADEIEGEIVRGRADIYAKFVIEDLKPAVDASLRTLSDRKNTAVGGSSYGGSVSLYIASVYNEEVGKVLCMSGAFTRTRGGRIAKGLNSKICRGLHRIRWLSLPKVYLDSASKNDNSDVTDWMANFLMEKIGYRLKLNLSWLAQIDAAHNEAFWSRRLKYALPWLFPVMQHPKGGEVEEIFSIFENGARESI